MSTTYIVIVCRIVGSPENYTFTYNWDGKHHATADAAIGAGLSEFGHDDFNIGRVEDGRLVWFGWQHTDLGESDEDMAEIAWQLGLEPRVAVSSDG